MFGVELCNASCFGIFDKQQTINYFLEDRGGPEKDL